VLRGELTPECATGLQALLDALGKRRGSEDTRTKAQRDHDALEEICRRLIAARGLPDRAGQPTQIQLHMSLDQLRGLPGADTAEAAWAGAVAGPGYDCDATIVPVVSGHVDPDVLDQLTRELLSELSGPDTSHAQAQDTSQDQDTSPDQENSEGKGEDASHGQGQENSQSQDTTEGLNTGQDTSEGLNSGQENGPGQGEPGRHRYPGGSNPGTARRQRTQRAVGQMLISRAADLLSGPGGLTAFLRNGISDRLVASVSLPLDVGSAVEIIPAHLRRAVIARDRRCRFPGCDQPVAACQPHHIIPRSQGGPTSLTNMTLMCSFHHMIAIHRWGWGVVLLPDGSVTATSPDRRQVLHSHGPPGQAA
jgi:hypothetical protein